MTTEIGWEKQLIDGIADTLVSVHPICNHSIPQRDDAAVRRSQVPFPCCFLDYVRHIRPPRRATSSVARSQRDNPDCTRRPISRSTQMRMSGPHVEHPHHSQSSTNRRLNPVTPITCSFATIGFRLLNVDCSRMLDLAHGPQTLSRHYDVSNDHTLTAVDPLVVQISIIRTYHPANYLPFLLSLGLNRKLIWRCSCSYSEMKRPAATLNGTEAQDGGTNRSGRRKNV